MSFRTRAVRKLRRMVAERKTAAGAADRTTAASRPVSAQPLTSTSVPGSRKASMFFDEHPRFYDTSETSPYHGRLNLRYEAIFAENSDVFAGARVLDIASHDGRWSLAALYSGAQSVVGIEARDHLVDLSHENLAFYGYEADRYTFIQGDIFQTLAKQDLQVDVVLCLGFLYHTLRYNELLYKIRQLNPRHLIVDTAVKKTSPSARATVVLKTEPMALEWNAAADEFSHGDSVLIGKPNLKALRMMMGAYDFEIESLSDWGGLIRDNPGADGVVDYANQNRITVRCRSVAGRSGEAAAETQAEAPAQ